MHHKIHSIGKQLCFFLAILLTACQVAQGPDSPMKVVASIEPEPIVGQVVTLYIEIMSDGRAMPNTTMTVTLPDGVEVMQDNLTWAGDIAAGEIARIDMQIKVTTEGEWPIEVYAYSSTLPDPNSGGFGDLKTLYVRSSLTSAEVIDDLDYVMPTVQYTPLIHLPCLPAHSYLLQSHQLPPHQLPPHPT